MWPKLILLLALFCFSTGCGLFTRIAVGTTSGLLYDASVEFETENNWEMFKHGVPANLKVMESLLYLKPGDEKLLVSLTKAYAGYAFAISETMYWDDYYSENDKEENLHAAIYYYSRALRYGFRYLAENDITYEDLRNEMNDEEGIVKLFDDRLDDDAPDIEGITFMAQAMGGLINLQKSKMSLIAQLPIVKGMFDWSCSKDPSVAAGLCDIFYGSYHAGRPKMLGGKPEIGKKHFLKIIKEHPDNWMGRIAYMQFYLIPLSDEDGYQEQKNFMEKAMKEHRKELVWMPGAEAHDYFKAPRVRFFQTIAVKRFEIIKKYEEDFF
jgi:hypothetical protein